jgi:hypothetical protein
MRDHTYFLDQIFPGFYKTKRVHEKHISCSQKLDHEQFQQSLYNLQGEMDTLAKQVCKEQADLILTYKIRSGGGYF